MPKTPPPPTHYGLDVDKTTLHLSGPTLPGCCQLPNTPAGYQALLALLPVTAHLVCEATGGYERAVVLALQLAGRTVSVLNPRLTRAGAEAAGQRAKSDALDAAELATYGSRFQPAPTLLLSPAQRRLQELVARRSQIVTARTAEHHQLEHLLDPKLCRQAQRRLRHSAKDLAQIDAWIAATLAAESARAQRIQQLEGFGPTNAATMLATVPELGSIGNPQVAHLCGVAPFVRQSGRWHGPRHIAGGRKAARAALYMAALTAIVHNHRLKLFYRRLLAAGKAKKLALVAVMRKIALLLNRLLRDQNFQLADGPAPASLCSP
jgi:transposase